MSNKIAFKVVTETKKKPAQQPQQQKLQAPSQPPKAQAPKQADVKVQQDAERKRQEEEKKMAIEKRRADFIAAKNLELEGAGKEKARKLDELFSLKVLASVPPYSAHIMNDRTIRYDTILAIPEVAAICPSWTDVVSLVKYCSKLKYRQGDYESVSIDYSESDLFGCIARLAVQIEDLPEKMSAGDLRITLGTYPLFINKKPNSTVAQVLFRDGIVKVSSFFRTKTRSVKKMVDGELRVVEEPFKLSTIMLNDEKKRPIYSREPTFTNPEVSLKGPDFEEPM